MARPHVWSNSTPSLPIPLLSSHFDQSSDCRRTPIEAEGQSQNGAFFIPRRPTHKRSHFQLARPASSSCLENSYRSVLEGFTPDLDSPSATCSLFHTVKQLEEPPVPFPPSPRLATKDLVLDFSQQKIPKIPLDHGFVHKVQNVPNLVRASSPMPRQSGQRQLLPPIDLGDCCDSEDSGASETDHLKVVSYRDYPSRDNIQRFA